MKPIKLTMQAFGPYKDLTVIDFSILYNDSLFLITGDTGSGKSSIFDAISFALYGEGSIGDSRRVSKTFRSHYVNDATETYVKLDFSHKGYNYSIIRKPEQVRVKKSGNGFTTQKATCEFHNLHTQTVITNVTECDNAIYELIGLSKNQFSQTCMIAQNEFLQILNSKSDDRKKLFQKIFNTEIYAKFQEELKNKYSECAEKHKLITSNILNEYNKLILDKENQISEYINSYSNISKVISLLQLNIKNIETKIDEYNTLYQNKYNDILSLNNEISQIESNNNNIVLYKKYESSLQSLLNGSSKVRELEAKTQMAYSLVPLNDNLDKQSDLVDEITINKSNLEKTKGSYSEYCNRFTELESSLNKVSLEYQKLDDIKDLNYKYNDLKKELQRKNNIIVKNDRNNKDINNLNSIINNKKTDLQQLKNKYYENQITMISSKLQDGAPCPVCGSCHHPNISSYSLNDVTIDMIDEVDNYIKVEENKLTILIQEVNSNNLVLDEINSKIMSLNLNLDITINEINTLINNNIDTINNITKQYNNINNEYNLLSRNISSCKSNILIYENIINSNNDKLILLRTEFNDTLKSLNIDYNTYINNRLTLDEINKNTFIINKYNNDVNVINGKIASLKEIISSYEYKDITIYKEKLKVLNDEYKNIKVELDSLNSIYNNNNSCLLQLNNLSKQLEKLNSYYAIISDLYKTVSGQITSKNKIQFETFVQQYYFKQVINEANKRLRVLTSNTFTLRLKEDFTSKRTQGGLDLECLDNQTGKWRDVSTLSGGESFMASLSLALGLSDVVSSKSGQVRIEAMFIDEGFGTLDENSLNQAINILKRLASSNRLIGIISHVAELKNRIDSKIVVKKTLNGSICNIEV